MKIPALGPPAPPRQVRAHLCEAPEGFPLRQWTCVFTVSAVDDVAHALPSVFATAVSEYRSAYGREPILRISLDGLPYILYRGIVRREHSETSDGKD